jgi:hypothetical protein
MTDRYKGSARKNQFKEQEKHPDYKGVSKDKDGNITGSLALWVKRNDDGTPWFSWDFELKDQQSGPGPAPARVIPANGGGRPALDDDIPF